MTCNDLILKRLENGENLAVHEFHINGYSENNVATRLSELAKAGLVIGRFRKGEKFKEWSMVKVPKVHRVEFYEEDGQMVFA